MRFTADSSGFSVSGKGLRFQDLPQVLQDFCVSGTGLKICPTSRRTVVVTTLVSHRPPRFTLGFERFRLMRR